MSSTTIFTESFETDGNNSRYTTSVTEFSDGSSDFFTRTDGSNITSSYEVTNPDGSFYFAAMDTDAEPPNADIVSILWEDINITNFTSLTFSGLFAEDDDGSSQDWDSDALAYVEYQIDGGGFTKLLQFASEGSLNTEPGLDSDFDGERDGTTLTSTFSEFSANIAETGSTLDLRFTIENLASGDEDIAFDQFIITGNEGGSSGAIGDFIWDDRNGNGLFDGDEAGIGGVTIDLIDDANGNGVIDGDETVLETVTTNSSGVFNFTGLEAGDYIVEVTDTNSILTDFVLTSGSTPLAITLSEDEDFNNADFGYRPTNAVFSINSGETLTIHNFGGVGSTDSPSDEILDEVDTLAFEGTDLTASNLLLTQQGNDLIISFDAENSPTVTLTNFDLEDFDNLTINNEVVGNIRFHGEANPLDEIDVIAANETPDAVARENITTFLNDLANTNVRGSNSADTVNAQSGNDHLAGKQGNDLMRGGEGDDTLAGGQGNDTLDGGSGNDRVVGKVDGDFLFGGNGEDILGGGQGDDMLDGGDDNDFVRGKADNDMVFGGSGQDIIEGNGGDDTLDGGSQSDTLTGGDGSDTFNYDTLSDSLFAEGASTNTFDIITDLAIGTDAIDSVNVVSAANVQQAGNVTTLSESGIGAILTSGIFVSNGAATFTAESGSRTFLALNDGISGFQVANDAIIEITGYTGDLGSLAIA
ncbi:MAG: SdrD B-like domain-containing protein [Cyanobacteria bacterium P01_F01_bin.86]